MFSRCASLVLIASYLLCSLSLGVAWASAATPPGETNTTTTIQEPADTPPSTETLVPGLSCFDSLLVQKSILH